MNRLTRYLVRLFGSEAAALFAMAISILFLVQCLRVIDAGAVRGRGLFSLLTQAVLSVPMTGTAFLYVCVAIGLARALRTLQATRELHILHTSRKLGALFGAIGVYALLCFALMMSVAHVIEPLASGEARSIRTRAAADLVGRALVPNRFAELTDGVTVTVGGRRDNGEITSFFADDRRAPTRRTYIADSALIASDSVGYVLQLENGSIQYRTAEGKFSEIDFDRYDMALDRLTGESDSADTPRYQTSMEIIGHATADGDWNAERVTRLSTRTVEGLRILALCLFVAAIAAFPSGRRRERPIPIELLVLGAAFMERLISTYVPGKGWFSPAIGVLVLTIVSLAILAVQLRLVPWPRREARA